MFVRAKRRFKDGKEHRYWSVVENVRNRDGRVVQRQVLYLGEINDRQRAAWCRSIEVLQGDAGSRSMALFAEDGEAPELGCEVVRIQVKALSLHRPRQWGACWLALTLWDRLELDRFLKRSDCVQVVIALIVTPEGFPLAYEVMPGNTSDKTTLGDFLKKIEAQYGRSDRVWIMDRGIPTEKTLEAMRTAPAPVHYLVGTPKGRLSKLEKAFVGKPWRQVRESVDVKLLAEDGELYVLAKSRPRMLKERGMRRRRLKKLWRRLHELRRQSLTRDELLLKLGAAKKEAGRAWHLVNIGLPKAREAVTAETFTFSLRRQRLRQARRREGRYLLRSNLTGEDPATLWRYYMQLSEIEQAFKELKHDLAIRPIFHQREDRIEAHIFVAFIAYCLHVTLKNLARPCAPGLTPRAILEKFATLQMLDVHLPTTDGRYLILPRHTQPQREHQLLLDQLKLRLPEQPTPRILA